jgi:hypothetical protein
LFGGETGAAGLNDELDSVGDDQVTADLNTAGRVGPRRRHRRAAPGQQFPDPLERQPCLSPLADGQQLLEVPLGVIGGARLADGRLHQPDLHVVTDGALWQLRQGAQLVEGKTPRFRVFLGHGDIVSLSLALSTGVIVYRFAAPAQSAAAPDAVSLTPPEFTP